MNFNDNKVIIITGAASGIGKSCVEILSEENTIIIAADISYPMNEFHELHNQVFTFGLDVSKPQSWKLLIHKIEENFSEVYALINCAGISSRDKVISGELDEWEKVIHTNVLGPYLGMKYCIPSMLKHKNGAIINLSSVGAHVGIGGGTVYPASKGAIYSMSKRVANDYGKENIRVNVVTPGWIKTNMTKNARKTTILKSSNKL
ncbi:SDR family oxidoreductase [[Eubacterium] hominis]|uniref:SDR family NAD(P)-dependent oxidoreductase n=1 Tax=[Eubacterium] hominis TaxID=2764325 RepID=UPI0022E59080